MIACDIDGTLLDYGSEVNTNPIINTKLIHELQRKTSEVALVTNQGGLVFGKFWTRKNIEPGYVDTPPSLIEKRKFPNPADFYSRISRLYYYLHNVGIEVPVVRISVFHPRAEANKIKNTAAELRNYLRLLCMVWYMNLYNMDCHVYTTERSRKPNPFMLKSAGATLYYGDSEEDEKAAKAAGIDFVKVERFLG